MDQFKTFQTKTADELRMSAADKLQLINDITGALGIGGWSYGSGPNATHTWDVTLDDVAKEWAAVEAAIFAEHEYTAAHDAYRVALLIAVQWERECSMGIYE